MILIVSHKNDITSNLVIEWLDYQGLNWMKIDKEDHVQIEFLGDDFLIITYNRKIKLSEIKSYWYRRGSINVDIFENVYFNENKSINTFLLYEGTHLRNYFYYLLSQKKSINNILDANINKLITAFKAKKFELLVPESHIINNKKVIKNLVKNKKHFITKTISGVPNIIIDDKNYLMYTKKIENIDELDLHFFPSLIQEEIKKKYELRIFYLDGDFFSMAIFSQNDNQTHTDFRRYNTIKPNRNVPFKLPIIIEKRLNNLMIDLQMRSGSIDMIVTPNLEYYFLEVNPIGQFGMVSIPCNYNIENLIANYLNYEKSK